MQKHTQATHFWTDPRATHSQCFSQFRVTDWLGVGSGVTTPGRPWWPWTRGEGWHIRDALTLVARGDVRGRRSGGRGWGKFPLLPLIHAVVRRRGAGVRARDLRRFLSVFRRSFQNSFRRFLCDFVRRFREAAVAVETVVFFVVLFLNSILFPPEKIERNSQIKIFIYEWKLTVVKPCMYRFTCNRSVHQIGFLHLP